MSTEEGSDLTMSLGDGYVPMNPATLTDQPYLDMEHTMQMNSTDPQDRVRRVVWETPLLVIMLILDI